MKPGVKPPVPAASDWRKVFTMKVPMLAPPSAIAAHPASAQTTCLLAQGGEIGEIGEIDLRWAPERKPWPGLASASTAARAPLSGPEGQRAFGPEQ